MPTTIAAYHCFTDAGVTYSGEVHNLRQRNGSVTFEYSYAYEEATVRGKFTGELMAELGLVVPAVVRGRWSEESNKPIFGKTSWKGTATLDVLFTAQRHILAGDWRMGRGATERWVIDAPNDE